MSFFVPSRLSLWSSDSGGFDVLANVVARELPKHQGRWTHHGFGTPRRIRPKITVQPDAQPDVVFGHARSVANRYTSANRNHSGRAGTGIPRDTHPPGFSSPIRPISKPALRSVRARSAESAVAERQRKARRCRRLRAGHCPTDGGMGESEVSPTKGSMEASLCGDATAIVASDETAIRFMACRGSMPKRAPRREGC
jgi:hypothetical protein